MAASAAPGGGHAGALVDVSGTYAVQPDNSIQVIHQNGSELTIHNSRWGPPKASLSGSVITAKVLLLKVTGVFDGGTITWSTGHKSVRTGPAPDEPRDALKADQAYYPGKLMKEGFEKITETIAQTKAAAAQSQAAKDDGDYQPSKNRLRSLKNVLKGKRSLAQRSAVDGYVGTLSVTVLGGSFGTSRPYFVLELDGNEERTAVARTSTPTWGKGSLPSAEYTFPLYDPSSDLRIFLCSDESLHNESAIGRIIVPVRSLCSGRLLVTPKTAQRVRFAIMPARKQWNPNLEARYEAAVPHVPGSGMVRPAKDLGYVDLLLRLDLTVPGHQRWGLLAAYAQVVPPGEIQEDAEARKSKPPPAEAKIFRGNMNRLKSCLAPARLLTTKAVFCMPFVLGLACAVAEPWHLPVLCFLLQFFNGLIDYRYRDEWTKDLIFWEESVGEADMPQGVMALKALADGLASLQDGVGQAADALSRGRNLWNFADAPVSAVAYLCLACVTGLLTLVLFLVPLRALFFLVGLAALSPYLAAAASRTASTSPPGESPATTRSSSSQAPLLDSQAPARTGPPRGRCLRALGNILGRVPDAKDIAHRYACALQVQQVSTLDEP